MFLNIIKKMRFFDQEILNGLSKVPTPGVPGTLIVTGDSQAVFTGEKSGDVILAAAEYGDGKILVCAHDCYLAWLNEKNPGVKKAFMDRVKTWLTGVEDLDDDEIGNITDTADNNLYANYRLIKWHHSYNPSEEAQQQLLAYIENGGALICGVTAWGYLQIFSNNTLKDMTMYGFLRDYTGIIITPNYISMEKETEVSKNKAKHAQFDLALGKIGSSPDKIEKYYHTVECGIHILHEEKLLGDEKIGELREQVLNQCSSCNMNVVPTEQNRVSDQASKSAAKLLGRCLLFAEGEKAPGVSEFPGDFDELPEMLEDVEVTLEAKFEERVSTGHYLPAGVTMLVSVVSGNLNEWNLRIGAHTDDISHCESYGRWPCVTVIKRLTKEMSVSSPFGGLIYFDSKKPSSLRVKLTNVVESPVFDLTRPETVETWSDRRYASGLWAELAGEHIIFTTPSRCVRDLDDPTEVMRFWDQVVRTHHECRGTNPAEQRRERIVNDKQPSCGYMHSGYPIVTHLDCCESNFDECIFDVSKLKEKGNWGLFHEIGHNMQRSQWTFDGAGEVTVNIFSMHANHFVNGQKVVDMVWPNNQASGFFKYFARQPTYQDWQNNNGMALITFAQLIKHFGWEPMHRFMSEYEADIKNKAPSLPKNNQEKIDQWVIRYSKILSRNIRPQFEMFGLPVSASVNDQLAGLQPWSLPGEKDSKVFFKHPSH